MPTSSDLQTVARQSSDLDLGISDNLTQKSNNHPARQARMAALLSEVDDEKNIEENLKTLHLFKADNVASAETAVTGNEYEAEASTNHIPQNQNKPDKTVNNPQKRPSCSSQDGDLDLIDVVETHQTKNLVWSKEVEREERKKDMDIRNYIPSNLIPFYTETRSLLEKRAKTLERSNFYTKCLAEKIVILDLMHKPEIPKGITLSAANIVALCSQIENSERDLLIQLNRVVKRSASILDVESTKALHEFGRQLDSYKVPEADFEKSKELLSTKIGRERAKTKLKYAEQLVSTKQQYKNVKKNSHLFEKTWGLVPRNRRTRTPEQPLPNRGVQKITGPNFPILGKPRLLARRNQALFRTDRAKQNEVQPSIKIKIK